LVALAAAFLAFFRQRTALQFEILALRHQLGVLQRSVKRPKLTAADRFLWAWLSAVWADWQPRMARKLDPPNPKFNQGLHLRPKLRDSRVGECPGTSTDQTGDAKIVDTAHTSGAPAVHD